MKNIEKQRKLKVYQKLKIYYDEPSFGYGVCELMKRIKRFGSINLACKDMKMAYSKAWKIIKAAEKDLGVTLVTGTTGGVGGGGSKLTTDGEEFLQKFEAFNFEARQMLDVLAKKHFS